MESNAELAPHLQLLRLFAYGTWPQYKSGFWGAVQPWPSHTIVWRSGMFVSVCSLLLLPNFTGHRCTCLCLMPAPWTGLPHLAVLCTGMAASLPALSPQQQLKLKQLTVVSLALNVKVGGALAALHWGLHIHLSPSLEAVPAQMCCSADRVFCVPPAEQDEVR